MTRRSWQTPVTGSRCSCPAYRICCLAIMNCPSRTFHAASSVVRKRRREGLRWLKKWVLMWRASAAVTCVSSTMEEVTLAERAYTTSIKGGYELLESTVLQGTGRTARWALITKPRRTFLRTWSKAAKALKRCT